MEKVIKVYEEGDYVVYASKEDSKALIVQIFKAEKKRRKDKDGNITIYEDMQKIYQKDVAFQEQNKGIKAYDVLDQEFRKEIANAKKLVSDRVKKDSIGRNILNKLEKEYKDVK